MTTHTKLKSIEEVTREAHIRGLANTEQAKKIDGEMTVLSFGYHSQLVGEAVQEDRLHILQTIREEVEGKEKKPAYRDTTYKERDNWCYNQALQDILTFLTTLEEEPTN